MTKFTISKIINIIVIPLIMYIIGVYMSELKGIDWVLAMIVIAISVFNALVCKDNEDIHKKNDDLNESIEGKNTLIKSLKDRISVIALYSNNNSPYKLQVYCKNSKDFKLRKHTVYYIEVVVSTISENFNIKYVNISFNSHIELVQDSSDQINGSYELNSNLPRMRSGMHEYNFKLKENDNSRSCGKCCYKIKVQTTENVEMTIEVTGDVPTVQRKEAVKFTVVE